MTTDHVIERRVAPRFEADFSAELAAGTVLVPIQVRDLSTSGCGVVILSDDPDLPAKLGGNGLLHLPATGAETYGTILSVYLRNVRIDDGRVTYGLEFAVPLPVQARELPAVLEAMGRVDPNAPKPDAGIHPGAVDTCGLIAILETAPSVRPGRDPGP